MLLRLLLITSAVTAASLVGNAFTATASQPTGTEALDPIAMCAPTPTDDRQDDNDSDTERRPSRNGRAIAS